MVLKRILRGYVEAAKNAALKELREKTTKVLPEHLVQEVFRLLGRYDKDVELRMRKAVLGLPEESLLAEMLRAEYPWPLLAAAALAGLASPWDVQADYIAWKHKDPVYLVQVLEESGYRDAAEKLLHMVFSPDKYTAALNVVLHAAYVTPPVLNPRYGLRWFNSRRLQELATIVEAAWRANERLHRAAQQAAASGAAQPRPA